MRTDLTRRNGITTPASNKMFSLELSTVCTGWANTLMGNAEIAERIKCASYLGGQIY
jgi:hypothetical protein